MKPSDFQKTVQCRFESCLKKVVRSVVKDYYKELNRRKNKEISFREYRQLFTKNQFHQAMEHAKVNNLSTITYEQVLSIFNSYLLFNGRK